MILINLQQRRMNSIYQTTSPVEKEKFSCRVYDRGNEIFIFCPVHFQMVINIDVKDNSDTEQMQLEIQSTVQHEKIQQTKIKSISDAVITDPFIAKRIITIKSSFYSLKHYRLKPMRSGRNKQMKKHNTGMLQGDPLQIVQIKFFHFGLTDSTLVAS